MTINVSRAINRYTAFTVQVLDRLDGHWDDTNKWVSGGLSEPRDILATVKNLGKQDFEGSYGAKLEPLKEGEHITENLSFTVKEEIKINSFIRYKGKDFKIVRVGDYSRYGYYVCVGRWGDG